MDELRLQRKVTCPVLPSVHLRREELIKRLDEVINNSISAAKGQAMSYKLIMLHAPAGYGKTILLIDFAQHTSLPCCWYLLDQTDADRMTFLTTLLKSIRQHFPTFGGDLDTLLKGISSEHANAPEEVGYFEVVLDALIAAIEQEITKPFLIALCNYQEINDLREINGIINYLLQYLPAHCILLIESRVIPDLDFVPLLANQEIFGIGTNQLRFASSEIRELVQSRGIEPLKDREIEQLVSGFNGWITGILLGTRLNNIQQLQRTLSVENLEELIDPSYLFSYVVNEVFKRCQEVYTFLKEASVLQEMSPMMCASLLDIAPSQASAHLRYLEQEGLFVTHNGEGTDIVYACTPVLRTLFYNQLRKEAPDRFSFLHQRAAKLLSADNNYSQAIYHALEAGTHDIAAELIIESAEQMINEGHAEMLARWIDGFPASVTKRHPRLLLIRANLYLKQTDHVRALPLLDAAEEALQTLIDQPDFWDNGCFSTFQAEISLARSHLLFRRGEYQQSLLLCQSTLANLPADEVACRAEVSMRLGVCHILQGNLIAGIAQIQKALQLWGRHTVRSQTADGHSALAAVYGLMGNFSLAEHHFARASACWEQLQDIWGKLDHMNRVGNYQMHLGAFSEAEQTFREILTLTRDSAHFPHSEAYALTSLGQLYQRQGQFERAMERIEEGLALARQIADQPLINASLDDLAMNYLYMGDPETAQLLLSEVELQTAMGDPIGSEQASQDMARGTILLYQHRYEQAWPYLSKSEAALSKTGLKEEHLLVLLRLAAVYLAQNKMPEVVHLLEIAWTIIPGSKGYEQLAWRELKHLPLLLEKIKTHPALLSFCASLSLKSTAHAVSPPESPVPVQKIASVLPEAEQAIKIVSHKLSIQALGEPIVSLGGEPITRWRMARAMELCFYLLDCSRPVRKESIITALWPEVDEQTTRTFYSTIYYLRQALGGESVIVAKGGAYVLRLGALYGDDVWYDVATFEEHQARAKAASDQENDEEARTAYLAMADLYHGDYVQSFYNDWCTIRRDKLRSAYLEALQQLALIAWRAEEIDESIAYWQQVLALDNWLEEAHYGLMRGYAHQGKRGLALRQYQRCKDTLQKEFGTTPKASIQNLYQRLMGSL